MSALARSIAHKGFFRTLTHTSTLLSYLYCFLAQQVLHKRPHLPLDSGSVSELTLPLYPITPIHALQWHERLGLIHTKTKSEILECLHTLFML